MPLSGTYRPCSGDPRLAAVPLNSGGKNVSCSPCCCCNLPILVVCVDIYRVIRPYSTLQNASLWYIQTVQWRPSASRCPTQLRMPLSGTYRPYSGNPRLAAVPLNSGGKNVSCSPCCCCNLPILVVCVDIYRVIRPYSTLQNASLWYIQTVQWRPSASRCPTQLRPYSTLQNASLWYIQTVQWRPSASRCPTQLRWEERFLLALLLLQPTYSRSLCWNGRCHYLIVFYTHYGLVSPQIIGS
ncbi:hypothetical protein J6590_039286 [Homalodisca vitripennis]|nr:hypothetical protein J6590_039286 [Homalodisca vitripennis]